MYVSEKQIYSSSNLPPKQGPNAKAHTNGSKGKPKVSLATNDTTTLTIIAVTGILSKTADAKAEIHKIMNIAIAKRFFLSTHKIILSVTSPIQVNRPNRSTHSIITNIAAKKSNVVHSMRCIKCSISSRLSIMSRAITPSRATHPNGRVLSCGTDCIKKQMMTNTRAPEACASSFLSLIGY